MNLRNIIGKKSEKLENDPRFGSLEETKLKYSEAGLKMNEAQARKDFEENGSARPLDPQVAFEQAKAFVDAYAADPRAVEANNTLAPRFEGSKAGDLWNGARMNLSGGGQNPKLITEDFKYTYDAAREVVRRWERRADFAYLDQKELIETVNNVKGWLRELRQLKAAPSGHQKIWEREAPYAPGKKHPIEALLVLGNADKWRGQSEEDRAKVCVQFLSALKDRLEAPQK